MRLCYHYCNVDIFISIIKNRLLRLSDINKSNDPQEGYRIFHGIFDYYASQSWRGKYNENEMARLMDLVQEFNCEMRLFNGFNVYAMCFSEDGDLLSQWRGYTQDEAGISIGFDDSILNKWSLYHHNKRIAEFKRIEYLDGKRGIKWDFDRLIELSKNVDFSESIISAARLCHPFYRLLEEAAISGYYYKDTGFFEENESRLLYWEYYHSDDAHNLEFWKESSSQAVNDKISEFLLSEVKYHSWSKGFKKYYELSFEAVKDCLVREIIIGPKCAVSVKDVEEFLVREGYNVTGSDGIRVKKSKIHIC